MDNSTKQIVSAGNSNVLISLPKSLQPLPKPKPAEEVEEDEYVEKVSKIIERDYFPDLKELRAQKELLEAMNEGDLYRAAQLKAQLDQVVKEKGKDADLPNLDQFQAKFTSEDNASFNELIQVENTKKKHRLSHFYEGEDPSKQLEYTNKLMIEGISKPVNTWSYSAKSALMYGPEGAPLTFADIPISRGGPKELNRKATRLVEGVGLMDTKQVDSSMERAKTDQVWKDMAKQTPALFKQSSTPLIGGFKMVPQTPDLRPDDDIDPSELMTWGMVESTPLLVDSSRTPRFSMAPTPAREVLSQKLSDKASQAIKKKQHSTSGFKKPSSRMASPALNMLAKKISGKSSLDSALRASYTPSGQTPRINSARATPLSRTPMTSSKPFQTPVKRSDNVTDGLLKFD